MTTPNFDLLRTAMMSQDFGIIDLLDMVSGFIKDQPQVGFAFTRHTGDILRELDEDTSEDVSFSWVISESYRRTFFDVEAASLYGTETIASNTGAMDEMAAFLIERFDRGLASATSGGAANLLPASDTAH